jgi:hypothetical protein
VYNPVSLTVNPSYFLQTTAWLVISAALAVLAFQPIFHLIVAIPLILVLCCYARGLLRHAFIFQQTRRWLIKNGDLYLQNNEQPLNMDPVNQEFGQKVQIRKRQVFHSLVLFSYQLKSKTYREIIFIDGVEFEAFRQFRCMIKIL